MKKKIIKFLSFICVLTVLLSVFVVPASASTYSDALPPDFATAEISAMSRVIVVSLIQEDVEEVPLYNQLSYPDVPYGNYGSVASHGCGITCLSMVSTYLLNDTSLTPDVLAKQFGRYNTEHGSYHILFEDSAEILGLDLQERTYNTDKVVEALQNGQVVIALQGRGLFTGGGHFIVLTGINEKGKILVNDPNGANYTKNSTLKKGFKDGFTQDQVFADGGPYWIYAKKEVKNMHFLGDTTLFNKFNAIISGLNFAKVE